MKPIHSEEGLLLTGPEGGVAGVGLLAVVYIKFPVTLEQEINIHLT